MATMLREGWNNAFYRGTMCYVASLVTIIFGLQIYRFFYDLPSDAVSRNCSGANHVQYKTLIPVIGAFFDEEP